MCFVRRQNPFSLISIYLFLSYWLNVVNRGRHFDYVWRLISRFCAFNRKKNKQTNKQKTIKTPFFTYRVDLYNFFLNFFWSNKLLNKDYFEDSQP